MLRRFVSQTPYVLPVSSSDLVMSWVADRLNKLDQYVMNNIPIRLICLSNMKLVGRNDVKKHFQASVPGDEHVSYSPADHVKYAILSHRWLDGEELTYEMMEHAKAGGPGYEKLEAFCNQARDYGMEFAWSDTCCIDKSSSTELDESIRSMFRWYRNSTICIVHLAQSESVGDILHDEWTTRGWTLQELLAPYRIKFFNKHWVLMAGGDNDIKWEETELGKILERATGVPHDALRRKFVPSPSKVDERMSWAAKRKTTRAEDVAYSLMGIFDVSLQIAYGEGGDRAFCRLIEAIMHAGDPSVLNWTGEAAVHHTSRAIPGAPESFVHRNVGLASGQLEMTMTSLGLRVPLVILPLRLRSQTYVGNKQSRIKLDCAICPTIDIDSITVPIGFLGMHRYALGIVNYSLISDGSQEVIGIRGQSAGFILVRKPWGRHSFFPWTSPPDCKPIASNFVGLKFVSPSKAKFTEWKLVDQVGLIRLDFPGTPAGSVFLVDREYLETVNL
jgi:hypothetical protein